MLLLQDNTPVNFDQVAVAKATNYDFEMLLHSPYVPYLAPSDFLLFSKFKSHLRVCHFRGINEVLRVVENILKDQVATFFCDGIAILSIV